MTPFSYVLARLLLNEFIENFHLYVYIEDENNIICLWYALARECITDLLFICVKPCWTESISGWTTVSDYNGCGIGSQASLIVLIESDTVLLGYLR